MPKTSTAKARAVKLAKQLLGRNAIIEESKEAASAEERAELTARRDEITRLLNEAGDTFAALQRAVSQVINLAPIATRVHSQSEAMEDFRVAVRAHTDADRAYTNTKKLKEERRQLNGRLYARRCKVSEFSDGPIPLSIQVCVGDSWEEIVQKLMEIQAKRLRH